MDVGQIMKILPHRYPILLVDRILELVIRQKGKVHSLVPRTETLEDLFVDVVKQDRQ